MPSQNPRPRPRKPATGATSQPAAGLRLESWPAAKLRERLNPHNWRVHPEAQLKALRAMIGQVGYAGAVLLNETTGNLIDGHARVQSAPEGESLPVLVGRWTAEQERQILVSLDPLAAMAQADSEKLAELTAGMEFDGDLAGLAEQLERMEAEDSHPAPQKGSDDGEGGGSGAGSGGGNPGGGLESAFRVLVECANEDHQQRVYEVLVKAGEKPRLMTIHA